MKLENLIGWENSNKERNHISMYKNSPRARYYLGIGFSGVYFTSREAQCMTLFLEGKTNLEVGICLGLSLRTIDAYLKTMREKLGCSSKKELINKVRQSQFVRPPNIN